MGIARQRISVGETGLTQHHRIETLFVKRSPHYVHLVIRVTLFVPAKHPYIVLQENPDSTANGYILKD